MSRIQVALRVFTVIGVLLAAGATQANDVSSDRHQASLQETSRGVEQRAVADGKEGAVPRVNTAHACTCSRATPTAKPDSSDLDAKLDRLRSQGG